MSIELKEAEVSQGALKVVYQVSTPVGASATLDLPVEVLVYNNCAQAFLNTGPCEGEDVQSALDRLAKWLELTAAELRKLEQPRKTVPISWA